MKRVVILFIGAAVLLSLPFLLFASSANAVDKEAFESIHSFYADRNIVTTLSTNAERLALNRNQTPRGMPIERLKLIQSILEKLSGRIIQPDGGIHIRPVPGEALPSGIAEVITIKGDCRRAEVTVHVFSLNKEKQFQLIREYDRRNSGGRPGNASFSDLLRDTIRRIEIHRWEYTADGWKKSQANMVLTD